MSSSNSEKPSITLPGTVEKVLRPVDPTEPEKAQITVEGADHLYREIRIENTLKDENGQKVNLKPGAQVDVTIEADPKETVPANS
jgi:predicted DNA-binding antitoxin AbrB/MazE fold protein